MTRTVAPLRRECAETFVSCKSKEQMRLSSPSSGSRDNDKNDLFELGHGRFARAGA
jgi:hypothetical protein